MMNQSTYSAGQTAAPGSRKVLLAGRIASGLVAAFLLLDAGMKIVKPSFIVEAVVRLGYPATVVSGLGLVLLLCTVLYLIPRSAFFGAVLLTGYLGGAVATNLRAGTPWFNIFFPVILGCIVWAGLALRSPGLRNALTR